MLPRALQLIALATQLNRTLVVPEVWCDSWWAAFKRRPTEDRATIPYPLFNYLYEGWTVGPGSARIVAREVGARTPIYALPPRAGACLSRLGRRARASVLLMDQGDDCKLLDAHRGPA